MEKVVYTDDEFIARLNALKGNQKALADEMGISPAAICKRKKKLSKLIAVSRGEVSAIVKATAHRKPVPISEDEVEAKLHEGEEEIQRKLDIMGMLLESNTILTGLLEEIRNEIKEKQKSNPLQRKQLMTLADKIQGLAKTYFDIQASLYTAKNAQIFIEAVLYVLQSVDPKLKREVVRRLGDTASLFQASNGSAPAAGDGG